MGEHTSGNTIPARRMSVGLAAGIFLMPIVFAWMLLRSGYSSLSRVLGFGWLAIILVIVSAEKKPDVVAAGTQLAAASSPVNATATRPAATPVAEVDPAAEREKNKLAMAQARSRFTDNQAKLKKYYATPEQVKAAMDDHLGLMAIALSRGMSKFKEDQKQAGEAQALALQVAAQAREMYASVVEEGFVKNGIDAKVRASGSSKERLTVTYALMSQPLVYKFQNEMKLNEQASGFGFKKLVYTNGFQSSLGETWSVDL
jgi:hypothetical protein